LYVAREPVIPLQLFIHRTILASSLTNLFMTMTVYATLFFVPVYLASVFDMSPQQVGVRLAFNFLGVAIGSFGAGIYMRKTGKYYWLGVLSPAGYVIGIIMICMLATHPENWWQFMSLFLTGAGYAAMLTVTLIALISAVPHTFQAVTTSIQYAFRGVGSTLGVALASSLFTNMLSKLLRENVHGPDAEKYIKMVLESVDAIRQVPVKYQPAIISSYEGALQAVFYSSLALAIFGVVSAACTGEHPLHTKISRGDDDEATEN
jgi:MFS family permease